MARSIKSQLYLFVKTLLLGGTYSDILDEETTLTGLDFVKFVNFWNSELLNPETKDNYPVPAVYFEFSNVDPDTINLKTNETSELETTKDKIEFTLHLISSKLRTENRDFDYLDMLDNADLIYRQLQNKSTAGIKDIKKIREPMDINNTVLMDYQISFTAILTNCGESEQIDASNPDINPSAPVQIQLNIGIAPDPPTPAIIPPFANELDTQHKTIENVNFAEVVNNLPAKFLPRVASFNAANSDIITLATLITIPINAVFEISFGIIIDNYTSGAVIVGDNINTSNFIYLAASLGIRISHTSGVNDFTSIVLDEGVFQEIKINGDGINITVQNLTKSQTETQSANMTHISIKRISGRLGDSLLLDAFIYYINLPNNNYYPTGQGSNEYDISGNNNHGTWAGTGTRFDYDENGSIYPNSNGYSLWQHATLEDIQVPFDVNGLPLSLTAGVDIPIGYTKTRDIIAGGDKWNMADALIDFDFDKLENTQTVIFDRSNAARQTAASRASLFYDSLNPYRYQINEIADPRTYDTFFEAGFKNRVFGKVVLDGTDLIRIDEVLNYENKKENDPLALIQDYCNIADIYP